MDWLLIGIGLGIGTFLSVTGFCAFLFARMGIRYVCGNDDDTLHKLHRRQRVSTLIVDRGPVHGDVPFNSLRP